MKYCVEYPIIFCQFKLPPLNNPDFLRLPSLLTAQLAFQVSFSPRPLPLQPLRQFFQMLAFPLLSNRYLYVLELVPRDYLDNMQNFWQCSEIWGQSYLKVVGFYIWCYLSIPNTARNELFPDPFTPMRPYLCPQLNSTFESTISSAP